MNRHKFTQKRAHVPALAIAQQPQPPTTDYAEAVARFLVDVEGRNREGNFDGIADINLDPDWIKEFAA